MASVGERAPGWTGDGRRPPDLPLVMDAREFGLPLDKLRILLEAESRHRDLLHFPDVPGQAGCEPLLGRVFGERLAARMESLLSRPGCRCANGFMWQAGYGARLNAHLDRPPLDVTMSIPIVCEGADRWPLWVEQPDGGRFEWAGTPGTVLIVDGRWRLHGRDAFEGTRSVVLLLHWTAPAVLWPGFLDEPDSSMRMQRGGMDAAGRRLDPGSAIGRRCSDLARLAVPGSMEPEALVRYGLDGGTPEVAARAQQGAELLVPLDGPRIHPYTEAPGRTRPGAELLVPLDGKATVTVDDSDGVGLRPGDGIAFPAGTKWRVRWHGRDTGKMLFGRSPPKWLKPAP